MRLSLTPAARRDLREIADWVAADDSDAADRFVAVLAAKARAIADMPLAFPVVPQLRRFGIRKRNHGDYLILYRVDPDRMRILRIVNGKRDYAALFR